MAAGQEGLMAKQLNSPYTPGRRGKKWLKIKTILEPLDLVVALLNTGMGDVKDGSPITIWRQETLGAASFWTWAKLSRVSLTLK